MILLRCISKLYCGQISWVVNIAAGSAVLGVNIPKLNRRLQYNICDIAGLCFAFGLVFTVDEVVHCAQYGQSNIWVSTLNPIFQVVCS